MNKIPFALLLWSPQDDMRRGFVATVEAVGEMDYADTHQHGS